jgi:uncharacterized protein YcfJ
MEGVVLMNPHTSVSSAIVLATLTILACPSAFAVQYGRVVSSVAVTQQVAVPQQQCFDEQQLVQPRNSGVGAVLGAVIGGALGNTIGHGSGRAAATGVGVVAGAALGDQTEANSHPPTAATVRRCQTVTRYENRVVGYDVQYDYNGQRYSTRMPQSPGEHIALDVTVAPQVSAPAPTPVYTTPDQAPPPVVYSNTAAPVVYAAPAAPYYVESNPGVVVVPRVVVGGGYWSHHHDHWH